MAYGVLQLLAVLRRVPPSAWDAIIPHGPSYQRVSYIPGPLPGPGRISVTPIQLPEPPKPQDPLLLAAAAVAQQVANAAIAAEAAGQEGASARIVSDAVDDWCGTGPHPIPWPRRWPFPWPPDHEPQPEWVASTAQVVGALSLASVASQLADGETRQALVQGAQQLLEQGLTSERGS